MTPENRVILLDFDLRRVVFILVIKLSRHLNRNFGKWCQQSVHFNSLLKLL